MTCIIISSQYLKNLLRCIIAFGASTKIIIAFEREINNNLLMAMAATNHPRLGYGCAYADPAAVAVW